MKVDLGSIHIETDGESIDASGSDLSDVQLYRISELPNLKQIDLSNNQLTSIDLLPLQALEKLQVLDISNNKLESIDGLRYCSNIQVLDLSNNSLARLDYYDSLEDLANLRQLYFNHNHLQEFDTRDLAACKNLEKLDLSNNYITWLDLSRLYECKSLNHIDISENPISQVHIGPLFNCPQLVSLVAPLSTRLMVDISWKDNTPPNAIGELIQEDRVEWVEEISFNDDGKRASDITVSIGNLDDGVKELAENDVVEAERLWLSGQFEKAAALIQWGKFQHEVLKMAKWSGLTDEQIARGVYYYWKPAWCTSPKDMTGGEGGWYASDSSYGEFLDSVIRKYGQSFWGNDHDCIIHGKMRIDERLFFDLLIAARRVLKLRTIKRVLSAISSRVKTPIDALAKAAGLRFSSAMSIVQDYSYSGQYGLRNEWNFPFLKIPGKITEDKIFICDNPDLDRVPEVFVEDEGTRVVYLVVCSHCSHKNVMGRTSCEKCGASL